VQYEHAAVLKEMTKEAERAEKLEKKLKITTHGYLVREKALTASIQQAWTSLQVGLLCSHRPSSIVIIYCPATIGRWC
jgi:hypothetical protein